MTEKMDNLPKDPFMLLSVINMKLRDSYDSLDSLCNDLDIDRKELCDTLAAAGFQYDEANNRFV